MEVFWVEESWWAEVEDGELDWAEDEVWDGEDVWAEADGNVGKGLVDSMGGDSDIFVADGGCSGWLGCAG